jgi:hypothetical protein
MVLHEVDLPFRKWRVWRGQAGNSCRSWCWEHQYLRAPTKDSCQSLVEQEIEGLLSSHWTPAEIFSVCAKNVFLLDALNHALELRPLRPVSNQLLAMAK